MQEIIERYLAAWNETDPAKRRELVDAVWARGRRLHRPAGRRARPGGGRRADRGGAAAVPRASCSRSAGPWTRTTTRPGSAGTWGPRALAEPVVIGFDVAVLDGEGRIGSVYGFLDKVPG